MSSKSDKNQSQENHFDQINSNLAGSQHMTAGSFTRSNDLLSITRRLQPASSAAGEFLKNLKVGAKVRVNYLITEGNKKRIQVFEGTVIAIKAPNSINGTFTVRKLSFGVGVERTYPIYSPNIVKVEVVSLGKVRRSKLYYLREALTLKDSKLKTKYLSQKANRVATNLSGNQLDEALNAPEQAENSTPPLANHQDKDNSAAAQSEDSARV